MSPEVLLAIFNATIDTLIMVAVAAGLGTALGLPMGVFLATSRAGELFASPWANRVLGLIVNATRSTPFIILVVAIIPFTRLIAGTSIGTAAAIVPLTVAATPFIARLVEGGDPRGRARSDRGGARHGRQPAADRAQGPAARGAAGDRAWRSPWPPSA